MEKRKQHHTTNNGSQQYSKTTKQPKMNELFLLKEAVSKLTPFPIYNKFEVLEWDLPKEIDKQQLLEFSVSLRNDLIQLQPSPAFFS